MTRKITRAAARIALGLQDKLYLGNLDAKRDWGHAKDYVEAMWLMLQQDKADDYVIATGETYTVREFLEVVEDIYLEKFDGGFKIKDHVAIDPKYFRPSEVELLIGNPTKAKEKLGWTPNYSFSDLVIDMVMSDFEIAKKELRNG